MGTKKLERRALRIHQVADRTGLPKENIVGILENAGYLILGDQNNFVLKTEHLIIIEKHFNKAVKNLFKKSKKNYKFHEFEKNESLKKFFSNFIIRDIESYFRYQTIEDIYESRLSDYLIKEFFYRQILSLSVRLDNDFSNAIELLQFRIKNNSFRSYLDFRKKSILFLLSGHYYVFSSEEDNSEKAEQLTSFSELSIGKLKEALNKFITDLKHHSWTITTTKYSLLG